MLKQKDIGGKRFEPTYEELKHEEDKKGRAIIQCFEPTYEELKRCF